MSSDEAPKSILFWNTEEKLLGFKNIQHILPTRLINKSSDPYSLSYQLINLDSLTYRYGGKKFTINDYINTFKVAGLIVVKDDKILYENYNFGNDETSKWMSFSVTKSVTSMLIGAAIKDGFIKSVNDPVSTYVTDLNRGNYSNVSIEDVLQMSSGIDWNEDYADPNSDINRFGRAIATGTSMRDFSKTLTREKPPGSYMHYVSINTLVLGFLLQEVTKKSISEYLYEKIWNPLGMEDSAYFILDDVGDELALGGLNATLRDYAKFGPLYLQKGRWEDKQILSEQWIIDSHKTDGDHLVPGERDTSSNPWGYGYQWWVPGFPDTDFTASGVYNQYIYIDPLTDVLIAKTSSNYKYTSELQMSKDMHVAMFRSIAKHVSRQN